MVSAARDRVGITEENAATPAVAGNLLARIAAAATVAAMTIQLRRRTVKDREGSFMEAIQIRRTDDAGVTDDGQISSVWLIGYRRRRNRPNDDR